MVVVDVDKIPPSALNEEIRGKRILNRNTDGTIGLAKRLEKQNRRELRGKLSYNNYNLIALWFSTLDMDWKKGAL